MQQPNSKLLLQSVTPVIAERGWDLFIKGKVQDIYQEGEFYCTTIKGTEYYPVRLSLNSRGAILESHCGCPCNFTCKHVAALWFALQFSPEERPSKSKSKPQKQAENQPHLRQLLAEHSAETLCGLIESVVDRFPQTEEFFTAKLSPKQTSEELKSYYSKQARSLLSRRFYDFGETIDLAMDVGEIIEEAIESGGEDFAVAIPIFLPKLFKTYECCDDSSGEFGGVIDYMITGIRDYFDQNKFSLTQKKTIIKFIHKEITSNNIYFEFDFGETLYMVCAKFYEHTAQFEKLSELIDILLNQVGEYQYPFFAKAKHQFLLKQNKTEEAEIFFNQNLHLSEFRKIAVNNALVEKDFTKAETLLLEAYRQTKGGFKTGWAEDLIKLYQITKDKIKLRHLLEELLKAEQWQLNLTHFKLWKNTFDEQDWISERNALIQYYKENDEPKKSLGFSYNQRLLAKLYGEEKLTKELYSLLVHHANISNLNEFAHYLDPKDDERIVKRYIKLLDPKNYFNLSDRKAYQGYTRDLLEIAKRYPTYIELFKQFVEQLIIQFSSKPRKPAFVEELEKLRSALVF
ncbi:SWIM zinc finger family protein [Caviibacterium pharyngocola]|uniref:SWIM-type domain-containing protein n=1 Tax=Caviibacterium pharyngocola TaxID=28159 RepID=A0A2M8RXN1_9PAST|nr:hypothetical protein [Caviibacterium pharyngocola]PJG83638.1 hypothetical protein CVP04_03105 [Caviibacterium pharyngocola]